MLRLVQSSPRRTSPLLADHRTLRVLVLATIVASFFALTMLLLAACLPLSGVRTNISLIDHVYEWQELVDRARSEGREPVVGMIGDSLTLAPWRDRNPKPPVPERLGQIASRTMPGVRMVPMRWGGLGPAQIYFVADELVAHPPDVFVWAVNLPSLAPSWTEELQFQTELASWIAPHRLPEALSLPLQSVGLSADQLLSRVAIRRLGLGDLSQAAATWQARATHARQTYEVKIPYGRHLAATRFRRRKLVARLLAELDPDGAALRIFRATLGRFQDPGAQVLVVAMPLDLDYWLEVGAIDDRTVFRDTVAMLRREVTAIGAHFVDLHDSLSAIHFRDNIHFTDDGTNDGTEIVAAALAAPLAAVVGEAGR